jgi:hypothetical protein
VSAGAGVIVRPAMELSHALSRSGVGRVILWLGGAYLLLQSALAVPSGGAWIIGMIAAIPLGFAAFGTLKARRERAARRSRWRALLFGVGLIAVILVMMVVGVASLLRRRQSRATMLEPLDAIDVERLARAEQENGSR